MPRKNESRLVFKLRYRRPEKSQKSFGVELVLSNNHRRNKGERGKLLGKRKIGLEELLKVGEHAERGFSPEFREEFNGRFER